MTGLTPPFFLEQFTDFSGKPLSGGSLTFLVAGSTSLPKNIYLDFALTNTAPNPLPLDGSGFAPQYYMESGLYKIVIKSSTGTLIATRDYIEGAGGTGSEDTYKVKSDVSDTNPEYLTAKLAGGGSIHVGTITIPGLGEKTAITDDGRIYTSSTDSTLDYLEHKVVNSDSITWETVGSVNKQLKAKINTQYGTVIPVWCIVKTTDPATPAFGLAGADQEQIWRHGYGVATTLTQGEGPTGYLRIYYLKGGTSWLNATWEYTSYDDGQLILNANHGLYDYLHKHPDDAQTDDTYSNYPAGLYVSSRSGDNHLWVELVVKNYPDPTLGTDAVLTYDSYAKEFKWIAQDSFVGSGAVKVEEVDNPRYLDYKIQAGTGISIDNVYNGNFGRFLRINATGSNPSGRSYASTMYVANAIQALAPNLISRSELITLFVPTTDIKAIQGVSTKFGCFMTQGGTGQICFTLRDEQYRLIAESYLRTNPLPQVFLELDCGAVYDPATGLSVPNYQLVCGGRYYLGILWDANGIQMTGDDAVQTVNTSPAPAWKVDNLPSMNAVAQLTGGSESKMRPFIRMLTGT